MSVAKCSRSVSIIVEHIPAFFLRLEIGAYNIGAVPQPIKNSKGGTDDTESVLNCIRVIFSAGTGHILTGNPAVGDTIAVPTKMEIRFPGYCRCNIFSPQVGHLQFDGLIKQIGLNYHSDNSR